MGVVNVTPDSFYPGSRYRSVDEATEAAIRLAEDGADILDIGGESTRPGGEDVSVADESARVLPVLENLRARTEALISIDTRKAAVAESALRAGADIVNDVSALEGDPRMADVVAEARAGVILMHMQGTPKTMQQSPRYDDVVSEVASFLARAAERAESRGIRAESIALDPGIGFGKTVEHNLQLLAGLPKLRGIGKPVVVGASRKSFIGQLLSAAPEHRLFGTAASVAAAVLGGAHIVRVHDVREMADVVRVADAIRAAAPAPPIAVSGESASS